MSKIFSSALDEVVGPYKILAMCIAPDLPDGTKKPKIHAHLRNRDTKRTYRGCVNEVLFSISARNGIRDVWRWLLAARSQAEKTNPEYLDLDPRNWVWLDVEGRWTLIASIMPDATKIDS